MMFMQWLWSIFLWKKYIKKINCVKFNYMDNRKKALIILISIWISFVVAWILALIITQFGFGIDLKEIFKS